MKIFKNRLFLAGACLILALAIGFIGVPVINNLTSQTVVVVRTTRDITMGTKFTEDMVETVEVGKLNLNENVARKVSDIVGLYATVDFKKGDLLYGTKVTNKLVLPENKIRQMESGEQTYSIKLGNSSSLRLLPNDIVQFHAYDENGNPMTVDELMYVSVVTTTTKEGVDILTATQTAPDGKSLTPNTITFILNSKQMDKLLQLEKKGNFRITLVYRGENQSMINYYLSQQKVMLYNSQAQTVIPTTPVKQ